MASTTTAGSGSPSLRFQLVTGTWSASGSAARGNATVPGANRIDEHDRAQQEHEPQPVTRPVADQTQRQEHEQAQEHVRREDLRQRQVTVPLWRDHVLDAESKHGDARHDAEPNEQAAGHGYRDMSDGLRCVWRLWAPKTGPLAPLVVVSCRA